MTNPNGETQELSITLEPIILPLLKMYYDEFKYYMTFGIVNTAGFGQI